MAYNNRRLKQNRRKRSLRKRVKPIAGAIYAAGEAVAPLREKGGLVEQATEVYEDAKEAITEAMEDVSDNVRAIALVAGDRLIGDRW